MTPFRAFLLVTIMAMVVGALSVEFSGTFTPQGPPLHQAQSAESYWERGSLIPNSFLHYHETFKANSRERGVAIYQDVYSLTVTNNLFPKHGMLAPIIASLFYGLFGISGFVLLNSILAGICVWGLFTVCQEISRQQPGWRLMFLMLAGTQLIFHFNHFSYDLLGLAFMLGGYALSRQRSIMGGFFISLSIFVRPVYIMIIPFVLIARWMQSPEDSKELLLGGFAAIGTYLLHNLILFGDAFKTTYQAIPMYVKGDIFWQPHPYGFELSVLLSNWGDKLFDVNNGAVLFNLSLLLAPIALYKLLKVGSSVLNILFVGGLINFIYLFSYPMWDISYRGNRFALPTVFLWLIVSYCLLIAERDREESK